MGHAMYEMVPTCVVQQLMQHYALWYCTLAVLAADHSNRAARHLTAGAPLQDSIERLSRQGSAQGTPVRQHTGHAAQPAQRPVSSQLAGAASPREDLRPDSAASGYEAALSSGGVTPASSQGMPRAPEQAQQAGRASHSSAPATTAEAGSGAALRLQLEHAAAAGHLTYEDSSPDLAALEGNCPQCCRLEAQMKRLQTQVSATTASMSVSKAGISDTLWCVKAGLSLHCLRTLRNRSKDADQDLHFFLSAV